MHYFKKSNCVKSRERKKKSKALPTSPRSTLLLMKDFSESSENFVESFSSFGGLILGAREVAQGPTPHHLSYQNSVSFLSSAFLRLMAFICSHFLIWLLLVKEFFLFFFLHLKTIFVHFISMGEGNFLLLCHSASKPQNSCLVYKAKMWGRLRFLKNFHPVFYLFRVWDWYGMIGQEKEKRYILF